MTIEDNVTTFIDRKKDKSKLLMILAGYKEFLWKNVFARLTKYIDEDIEVCIISSGLYSEKLDEIAKENDWSYLYTSINNLCLVQNECIEKFNKANYIFKMDEDIFVTKDIFSKLFNQYENAKKNFLVPSSIVPMLNVNCITYNMLLKEANLIDKFTNEVGFSPIITNGLHHHRKVLKDANMAKFMWSNIDIDTFEMKDKSITFTPGRFSIGLIMFERSTWEDFKHFPVNIRSKVESKRIGLGDDEETICNFSMEQTRPLLIDKSSLAGHLSYGPQTKEMVDFYNNNEHIFEVKQ